MVRLVAYLLAVDSTGMGGWGGEDGGADWGGGWGGGEERTKAHFKHRLPAYPPSRQRACR